MSDEYSNPYASSDSSSEIPPVRDERPAGLFTDVLGYGRLSRLVNILLIPGLILFFLVGAVALGVYSAFDDGLNEDEMIEWLMIVAGCMGGLGWLVGTGLFVTWMIKGNRAVRKAGMKPNFGPWWALFGFVVPFLSFWIPYAFSQESYRAARALAHGETDWRQGDSSAVIICWWILFTICTVVGNFFPDDASDDAGLMFLGLVFVCWVFYLWMQHEIIRAQEQAQEQGQQQDPGNQIRTPDVSLSD